MVAYQRLIPCIGENVQDGAHDPVHTDRIQLLACSFSHFICHDGGACGGDPHRARELADVYLIKKTVDASIFLV